MGDIPITDDKPKCPCGSHLVFLTDHSERGYDFWRCLTCGHEMVTQRPYRPVAFPLKRNVKRLWKNGDRSTSAD